MSKSQFNAQALTQIFADCLALGVRKNHDYGAARDTILDNGIGGIATRMDDKQARIMSLTRPGHEPAVRDESLRDTLRDQINYAAYGIMILDGTWGKAGAIPESITDLYAIAKQIAEAAGVAPGIMRFAGYEMDLKTLEKLFQSHGSLLPPPALHPESPFNCRCIGTWGEDYFDKKPIRKVQPRGKRPLDKIIRRAAKAPARKRAPAAKSKKQSAK